MPVIQKEQILQCLHCLMWNVCEMEDMTTQAAYQNKFCPPPPPFDIALDMSIGRTVCRNVGHLQFAICAQLETLNQTDFKLGSLIHINMKYEDEPYRMAGQWVKVIAIFGFVAVGELVFHEHILLFRLTYRIRLI